MKKLGATSGRIKYVVWPLLLCLLWCNTCLEWLRNSNVYNGNGCHIFRIIPCWCASLFQSANALWPAFLAKIWQTMGTPALNAGASHSRWIPAPQAYFFWWVLHVGERLCVNSQRVFHHFIPSKSDIFEGHIFDTCVIIVATWWEVGWTSEIPQRNSHCIHKVLIHIKMKSRLQHPLQTITIKNACIYSHVSIHAYIYIYLYTYMRICGSGGMTRRTNARKMPKEKPQPNATPTPTVKNRWRTNQRKPTPRRNSLRKNRKRKKTNCTSKYTWQKGEGGE